MKKLLIIVLLLTVSWTIFSQDTRTKQVKVSTLIKIKKDLDKCDSLKIAYAKINKELDTLVLANLKMYSDFDRERSKREVLQEQINHKESEYKKLFQKPNNGWVIPVLISVAGGIVIGVSL